MAAVRIKTIIIDGIKYEGLIDASLQSGIPRSTLQRKCKENANRFEYKGKKIEHYLIKPEIKKDERKEKQCTSCKNILPNNTDYFRLDSAKVRLNHGVVLTSQCISCKEKQKSELMIKKRLEARESGTTLYAQMTKEKQEYHIKRNSEYGKINRDYINGKVRERRKRKTQGAINANLQSKKRNKEEANIATNYYIARLIYRNNKELTIKELLSYPDLLDLHRSNLKLKRACKALETSMN
jgi:hypothetical protein